MTDNESAIQQILKTNNGIVTTTQVTEAGIPRRCLSEMVESGTIHRVDRGIYALPYLWAHSIYNDISIWIQPYCIFTFSISL